MSRARILLIVLLSFLGGMFLGYVATLAAILGYWDLAGVHDTDGGGGMAVAYGLAPAVALVTGTIAATVMASRLTRHARAMAAPSGDQTRRDQRRLLAMLGLLTGLALGFVAAGVAQGLLRPLIFESRIVFKLFENAHEILIPLCGAAGALAGMRWKRNA